jgi:hypothetical protein
MASIAVGFSALLLKSALRKVLDFGRAERIRVRASTLRACPRINESLESLVIQETGFELFVEVADVEQRKPRLLRL